MCLWRGQMVMRENSTTHWSVDGVKGIPIQTLMKAFQPGVNPGDDLPPTSWTRRLQGPVPRRGGVTRIRLGVGFEKCWDRKVKVGEVGWVSANPNSATQTQTFPTPGFRI